MSAHTPGPWVTGNTQPLLFGVPRGPGIEPIGFVYGPSFPERSVVGLRALANVRIIAAAPRMLAALEMLHERLIECSRDPISAAEAYDSFYQLEVLSAIAAAKGEQ